MLHEIRTSELLLYLTFFFVLWWIPELQTKNFMSIFIMAKFWCLGQKIPFWPNFIKFLKLSFHICFALFYKFRIWNFQKKYFLTPPTIFKGIRQHTNISFWEHLLISACELYFFWTHQYDFFTFFSSSQNLSFKKKKKWNL